MQSILKLQPKTFSFPSLPIIFLLDYWFKKCPVYSALVLHAEILGGTSGENQVEVEMSR